MPAGAWPAAASPARSRADPSGRKAAQTPAPTQTELRGQRFGWSAADGRLGPAPPNPHTRTARPSVRPSLAPFTPRFCPGSESCRSPRGEGVFQQPARSIKFLVYFSPSRLTSEHAPTLNDACILECAARSGSAGGGAMSRSSLWRGALVLLILALPVAVGPSVGA